MKTECNLKSAQQFGHNGKGDESTSHSRIQRLKAHAKVKALERASNTFKSENPFFLTIPTEFVREHLMKEHRSVTLCNYSGKTWIANFKQSQIGKNQYSYLQTGWGTFVRDNNIQFNDVCAFELINSTEISFKVVIYKGQHANCHQILASEMQYPYTRENHSQSDEILEQNIEESEDDDTTEILEVISPSLKVREELQSSCPQSHKMMSSTNSAIKTKTLKTQEKFKVLERVRNTFKSENPFFLLVIQPSYVALGHTTNFKLAMPCNFVKENLMKKHCSVILCNSSGKTWIATFKQRKIGKKLTSYLIAGCGTFARDNNIQVGDVCASELINSIHISFKVVIYQERPVKHKAPSYASQGCPEPLTALEKAKAFQTAGAFKSENPFFVIVLQPSHVHGNKLSVPMNFARKYLTMMHKKVIHLLSDGNSWPVIYDPRFEWSYVFLCNGWHRFAVDNNLEVGDVCVFELTGGIETSMK
ncbi:hypothetical protein Gorai_023918, partial [Gossypium raimondii]|nr:hypothetical protein [Gossypium raimondii]